jgi:phosphoribosylglycinamide formyltransferase 1
VKIGILISGRGSNMSAIAKAVKNGKIANVEIVVVISDKPDAPGIEKAKEFGIETLVIERNSRTREEHDGETVTALKERNVELVCLAGYMRLLSGSFVKAFSNKIINIHPSLLPAFPGLDSQKQAIDYGVKISGCTVHFVDEQLDHGAIIAQRSVDVILDDTEESLSEKILREEHVLYAEVLSDLANRNWQIVGRKVVFD